MTREIPVPVQEHNRNDIFFELGGHSLMVTRLTGLLRKASGVALPLHAIFLHITLAGMSALLENYGGVKAVQLDTAGPTATACQKVSKACQHLCLPGWKLSLQKRVCPVQHSTDHCTYTVT
ncbi:Phosphopantetheine attachment site [Chitinophaga costaii]|uniref:Phosphopantetheine attachment site n=1 Tax=Chitinophaga costaii TaxID=1335309 RepID=A0A1C4FX89_9BACT|nr:phosphopantetheine-binding protein [Chitinophaga costaii]PUZ20883.1 acyl carrier protein [Chitinophaga costaii]SCC60492.1 Phosphopantetheine attachment site [Chitinophaga costaii]